MVLRTLEINRVQVPRETKGLSEPTLGLAAALSFPAAAKHEGTGGIWKTPQVEGMELRVMRSREMDLAGQGASLVVQR